MNKMRTNALNYALRQVGARYSQPKRLLDGYYDCSSLTARAYIAAGLEWGCKGGSVPRSLYQPYDDSFELLYPATYAQIGKQLPSDSNLLGRLKLGAGDLIFAATKSDSTRFNRIEHVVMARSTDRIVHARGTAYGVIEDRMSRYARVVCAVTRYNPGCALRLGHIGRRVRAMQEALNREMEAGLTVDGEFGVRTMAAVVTAQKRYALAITGDADIALQKALGMTVEENLQESVRPQLRKGAAGADVRDMQNRLIVHGYPLPRYGTDGKFGAETLAALVAFQKAKGLAADGIAGPMTWSELEKAPVKDVVEK